MAKKQVATVVDPVDIPEVVDFLDAQDAIKSFREENEDFFTELGQLVEKYNTTRQAADAVVRQKQVTCGPWDLYTFTIKYDAETLYNALGRDMFLMVGGEIKTKTEYSIDKARLEAAAAQGKVSKDIFESVRKVQPTFHSPKDLNTP